MSRFDGEHYPDSTLQVEFGDCLKAFVRDLKKGLSIAMAYAYRKHDIGDETELRRAIITRLDEELAANREKYEAIEKAHKPKPIHETLPE